VSAPVAGAGPWPSPVVADEASDVRDFNITQLRAYDGISSTKIYFAIFDTVFDVTSGASFYGPQGGYKHLGGRDATRALAEMSLDPATTREPMDLSHLSEKELETARQWHAKLSQKYPIVGRLVRKTPRPERGLEH